MDSAPYYTDHALMDAEHRTVQQWAEEAVLRLRRAQPFEDCVYALDVLTHLARSHFAHEEIEMHTMGYPAVSAHVLDHRLLLGELARLRTGLAAACASASGRGPRRALVERLSAWMLPHIEGHDGGYVLWLRRRAPGASRTADTAAAVRGSPGERPVPPKGRQG